MSAMSRIRSALHDLWKGPTESESILSAEALSHSLSRARNFELKMDRMVSSDLLGDYASAFLGQGLSFSELRDYQPGDDPRLIHWNVSARFGKPYIKVFHEERHLRVIIALDVSRSMLVEERYLPAVEFAGFLLATSQKKRDSVGLVKFSDEIHEFIPPAESRAHFRRTLLSLMEPTESSPTTDLSKILTDLSDRLPKGCIIFVLSDFESTDFSEELRRLAHSHLVSCIYFPGSDRNLRSVPGTVRVRVPETTNRRVVSLADTVKDTKQQNPSTSQDQTEHTNKILKLIEGTGANAIPYETSTALTLKKIARLERKKRR